MTRIVWSTLKERLLLFLYWVVLALLFLSLFLYIGSAINKAHASPADHWFCLDFTGGGTGALDAIAGNSVSPNSYAFVRTATDARLYKATFVSQPAQGLLVIRPTDVGAGITSWEQQGVSLTGVSIFRVVTKPASLGDPDNHTLWINNTGTTFYITQVRMTSETTGATASVVASLSSTNYSFAAGTAIVTDLWPSTAGTSVYYVNTASGVSPVPDGSALIMDNGSGTPNTVTWEFGGYLAR